jgi:hypothetical protein
MSPTEEIRLWGNIFILSRKGLSKLNHKPKKRVQCNRLLDGTKLLFQWKWLTACRLDFTKFNYESHQGSQPAADLTVKYLKIILEVHSAHTFAPTVLQREEAFTERRPAVALHLMSSTAAKHRPRSPIFSTGKSQKSDGARSGEHGGCGMTSICFAAKNCGTAKAEWFLA